METMNFNKEILDFNKNAAKLNFDALNALSTQAAVAADYLLGIAPGVPAEGKKAVSTYFKESHKGLTSLKKYVDSSLELNWTAKDAPVKNLAALEAFCKDTFSQAVEIKKEAITLVEKAGKQLPKEAQSIVGFWAESVNNMYGFFQSNVDKNLELAKKVVADVSVSAPTTEPKAATK